MTLDIIKRHNVRIFGKGTQPLLFAHGLACDQQVWRLVTTSFENNYKIILFDFIGSGQSDISYYDKEKYSSLRGYAEDILDICSALELQNIIFVGHSVSSMIGMLAAITRPDLFFKLIMVGPSPRYINDKEYYGGFERREIDELINFMETNYIKWASYFAPLAMANPDRPELSRELIEGFCKSDPSITIGFARVTFLSDNRTDLPRLQISTLILQTEEDIVAPRQVGEYIHRNIPKSTLYVMKAKGHFPQLSAFEETVDLIIKYLKENIPDRY